MGAVGDCAGRHPEPDIGEADEEMREFEWELSLDVEGEDSDNSLQSLSISAPTSASLEASSINASRLENLLDMSSLCFVVESSSNLTELESTESWWDIWICSLISFTFPAAVDTAVEDTEEIMLDVELIGASDLLEDETSGASFILLVEGSSEEESEGFDEDKLDFISLSLLRDELTASSLSSLSLKPSWTALDDSPVDTAAVDNEDAAVEDDSEEEVHLRTRPRPSDFRRSSWSGPESLHRDT